MVFQNQTSHILLSAHKRTLAQIKSAKQWKRDAIPRRRVSSVTASQAIPQHEKHNESLNDLAGDHECEYFFSHLPFF